MDDYTKKIPLTGIDVEKFCNALVRDVWDRNPDLYEGRTGPKPQEISVAAITLAYATQELTPGIKIKQAVVWALSTLLDWYQNNSHKYTYNEVELKLFDEAKHIFEEYAFSSEGPLHGIDRSEK